MHISCLQRTPLNTKNPSFHLEILTSLKGVFWNTLTPLELLIRHI